MSKCYSKIVAAIEAGESVIFTSVVRNSGSTPGAMGTHMIVYPDGETFGTVGGGAIEYEVQQQAIKLFKTKSSYLETYQLTPNEIQDLGMVCGGRVTIYYHYIDPCLERNLAVFSYLSNHIESGRDIWLLRHIKNFKVVGMGVWDKELHLGESDFGEIDIHSMLGNQVIYKEGIDSYLVDPVSRAGKVYIFGGGHVSQALAPIVSSVDFPIVIYEDREAFAKTELFPEKSEIVLGSFLEIDSNISISEKDYIVIMTRGHQADFEVLSQVLNSEATYIGCIGSKTKVKATMGRLEELGFSQKELSRIHSPIGIAIGGRTPAEIAISITAQLIAHRARIKVTH